MAELWDWIKIQKKVIQDFKGRGLAVDDPRLDSTNQESRITTRIHQYDDCNRMEKKGGNRKEK